MIHYAQLLLLAHLAEAAPRPIPMTPWWVVTFLWCQLHGQLIGTGLHVRTSSFLAVVTQVEFFGGIFNLKYHHEWNSHPTLRRAIPRGVVQIGWYSRTSCEKIPPRWNFGNNTGVCWEKWHKWRTDAQRISHLREMSHLNATSVTSKQQTRSFLTSFN
jgi:hypothetical protein